MVGDWSRHTAEVVSGARGGPQTPEAVDKAIPLNDLPDPTTARASGRADLADALLRQFGDLYPLGGTSTPLWDCHTLWGFEGLMTNLFDRPDLVHHACERMLARSINRAQCAAAVGARGVWMEECFTDMISPSAFAEFNAPYVKRLVEAIRATGMQSIYYYCGNPAGKWDLILDIGADALALEESKKGFTIDIAEVVDRVAGRCAVLGNLDAIGLLEHGTEQELRREIERQIRAGRRNGNRFIMSIGSPVTPGASMERVRLFCRLSREIG